MFDWAFLSGLLLCLLPLANMFSVGCCCKGCKIDEDDFNRPDDSDINVGTPGDARWDPFTTCDITSNKLRITAAGYILAQTQHPDAVSTMSVAVEITNDTSGGSCDLLVAWLDSNNYFYARYIFGTGSIQIRKVEAGVDSLLESVAATLTVSTDYSASVCVAPNGVIAASLSGTTVLETDAQTVSGTFSGLGKNGTGIATFDDWVFSKAYNSSGAASCPVCDYAGTPTCTACDEAVALAKTVTIQISGVTGCAASAPFGDSCAQSFDHTYVTAPGSKIGGFCIWRFTAGGKQWCSPGPVVSIPWVIQVLLEPSGSDTIVNVELSGGACAGNSGEFQRTYTGLIDCHDFVAQDIPWVSNCGFFGCDFSTATCTVTFN